MGARRATTTYHFLDVNLEEAEDLDEDGAPRLRRSQRAPLPRGYAATPGSGTSAAAIVGTER